MLKHELRRSVRWVAFGLRVGLFRILMILSVMILSEFFGGVRRRGGVLRRVERCFRRGRRKLHAGRVCSPFEGAGDRGRDRDRVGTWGGAASMGCEWWENGKIEIVSFAVPFALHA